MTAYSDLTKEERRPFPWTGRIYNSVVKTNLSILLTFITLLALSGSACAQIQKQRFDQIIDRVRDLYAPKFDIRQQRLVIMDYWESERLEASARYDIDGRGRVAVITVTGGLARHEEITEGAFALILCHEIGHFLAGPRAIGRFSTEGQADYFAASACMRQLIPRISVGDPPEIPQVPDLVRGRCGGRFETEREVGICIQTALAGLALSRYFAQKKNSDSPRFEAPDPNRAKVLGFGTRTAQCRLDTYVAAALCNPEIEDATYLDRRWLCSRKGGLSNAARPPCWYPDTR